MTSGVDGIYPKGFVIGKVERVENGEALDEIIGEWTSHQDGWALADSLQAQAIAAAKVEWLD